MKTLVWIFSVCFVLVAASGCYYDNEENKYPEMDNQCDTITVTYSLSVKPILQNSCYRCHSNGNSSFGGNIRLEDYDDVKLRADDGKLIGTISHAGGFPPMPQGSAKLEDCKISIIRKWIESGAPDN